MARWWKQGGGRRGRRSREGLGVEARDLGVGERLTAWDLGVGEGAVLLCALICVVGLALVARCAWLRRASPSFQPQPPTKGLKKKALRSLPMLSFDGSTAPAAASDGKLLECPICLAEFAAAGDEVRILPHCGHGFHVACVDIWLGSHSSCPSCRQILVVPSPSRCPRCGATSDNASTAAAECGAKAKEATPKREEDFQLLWCRLVFGCADRGTNLRCLRVMNENEREGSAWTK